MRLAWQFDHHNGAAEWDRRRLRDWLADVFDQPSLRMRSGVTQDIRQHIRTEFEKEGWAINVKIHQDYDLSVFALKDDLAVQLQTGNMSRAPYDLLKLQYLYTAHRVEAVALAVPTKTAAEALGSNIAHADRISSELLLFSRIITVPTLLVGFE